jgi:hypothetical protein
MAQGEPPRQNRGSDSRDPASRSKTSFLNHFPPEERAHAQALLDLAQQQLSFAR